MRKKRIFSLVIAATMILGQSIGALAADLSDLPSGAQSVVTGEGELEGYVVNHVTRVVLPTSATDDFVIDPQGLLGIADSVKYGDGEGAVYFENKDPDSASTYSNTSDELVVVNKSSFPVDVKIDVTIQSDSSADLTQIALVADSALATTATPAIALKLITDNSGAPETADITSATTTVTKAAAAVPTKAAEVKYAAGDVVYIPDGSDPDTVNFASGDAHVKDTNWKAESAAGFTVEKILKSTDDGIVGTETKIAAVADGYELVATTESSSAPAGTLPSPSGYYYYYELDSAYESTAAEQVKFKLSGATNTVTGWKDVTEKVDLEVTYEITEHQDAPAATPITLCTVAAGVQTNLVSTYTRNSGVYMAISGTLLVVDASKLTSVKVDGTDVTPSITGNSAGNGGALYLKFADSTRINANSVVTLIIDGVTYSYTFTS